MLVVLSVAVSTPCLATEEYAESTGRSCGHCHVAEAGGGELTAAGTAYLEYLQTPEPGGEGRQQAARPLPSKLLRALVGYLHAFTGIFWFGTILYVHLVLKPSYAAGGLPRGEVRVGLGSMVVMGVTGFILTLYRVPDLSFFVETRFGVLLAVKIVVYLGMVGSAMVAVFVIGPRLRRQETPEPIASGDDVMTPDQLAAFDGREGGRALIGYRGEVYDVSGSRSWAEGRHFQRHQAGNDLTEMLIQAPHGEERVLARTRVASLAVPEEGGPPSKAERAFLAIAYFNLVNVCLIILVLALWRWW